MPENFLELATPLGLAAVVLVVTAILKKLNGPEGSLLQGIGDWIRANARMTSVFVAGGVGLVVFAVRHFSVEQEAQAIYELVALILTWFLSQGMYHVKPERKNV